MSLNISKYLPNTSFLFPCKLINRPGVARVVLQAPLLLIHSFIDQLSHSFPPNLQTTVTAKPELLGSWTFEKSFTSHPRPNQSSHLGIHKQTNACWSIPTSQTVFYHLKICRKWKLWSLCYGPLSLFYKWSNVSVGGKTKLTLDNCGAGGIWLVKHSMF